MVFLGREGPEDEQSQQQSIPRPQMQGRGCYCGPAEQPVVFFFYGGGAGNHLIQATPLNWKLTAKLNKNSKVFFGDTGGISMLIFLKKKK